MITSQPSASEPSPLPQWAAHPATHVGVVAYAKTLGLQWVSGNQTEATVLLPYSDRTVRRGTNCIETLALIGLLDHTCSAALYLHTSHTSPTATTELRVGFGADPDSQEGATCTATTLHLRQGEALVEARCHSSRSSSLLAHASATFATGLTVPSGPTSAVTWSPGDTKTFVDLLALNVVDGGFELPFSEQLLGGVSPPTLHGGATGAAMCMAARMTAEMQDHSASWRLTSCCIQYIRRALSSPLIMKPSIRKQGKRSMLISIDAVQQNSGKLLAHAECVLARA